MSFEIETTIQSQYAASPVITSLVKSFYDLVSPYDDIELFYNDVFNLKTAVGWGLDVWGRIVGIDRWIDGVYSDDEYLGWDPPNQAENELATPWDQAPFGDNYEQYGSTVKLLDNAYYLLIMTKAAANIGTGSLAELNQQLDTMLPDRGVGVINAGTMKIRIYVRDILQPYELNLLTRGDLPPIPAGVGFELIEEDPYTLGFDGSDGQPWDQGVFCYRDGVPIYVD